MAVTNTHPDYSKMTGHWELGRDSYEGEAAIKDAGEKYLPPTAGQRLDQFGTPGSAGNEAYLAYKQRAVYPDLYGEAVRSAIGIMHRKPATFNLPAQMEHLLASATPQGESLEMLLRRINTCQLSTGRIGILGDIQISDGEVTPVITTYSELAIRNWATSDGGGESQLKLVVLDESSHSLNQDFTWEFKESYRVLALADQLEDGAVAIANQGNYAVAEMDGQQELNAATFETPEYMGNRLDKIPFAFINSQDISPKPDLPPMLGLANLCLAIYRGEADYRQNLFMQGQDTLVTIGNQAAGDGEAMRTGAGARIDVPINGDAKYIGVGSNGLPEQRQSLENDYKRAQQKSGQLQDTTSRAKESGDALRVRVSAQTATLPQVAKAGAAGLEDVLKTMAVWFGAKPEDVEVIPNLDFTDKPIVGRTLVELTQSKTLGAPIAKSSIHAWMVENKMTTLSYEEELTEIESEGPSL